MYVDNLKQLWLLWLIFQYVGTGCSVIKGNIRVIFKKLHTNAKLLSWCRLSQRRNSFEKTNIALL